MTDETLNDTPVREDTVKDQAARDAAARVAEYEHGWVADIEQEYGPKGLSEDTVRFISAKKDEPEWMLEWRLKAYRHWLTMPMPDWAKLNIPPIDYQEAYYWAAPKKKDGPKSLDEVDPEILRVYEKLGIPLAEQEVLAGVEGARKVAVDAVFDSVSVATTFRKELEAAGVIFRSISEAIREYPDLVRRWLGKVVPMHDNYFAALNCAVFSDGTFVYIPEGVRCPMELSTYFRINAENTGQFERTLIVADKGAYVSYLEGCTAPQRDENQLHAAVVELVALDDAEIKYSTVQNWYPGDAQGKGGIYNFVTKRALCQGARSKVSWTQVETGSAVTWKYPSCVLNGEDSVGEFYSVAVTNNFQQADTGTKMIHNGKRSRSTIVSQGDQRGQVQQHLSRPGARGPAGRGRAQLHPVRQPAAGRGLRRAHRALYRGEEPSATIEHEATTSKISDDQLFYAMQRGLDQEQAVALIVNGFAKEVLQQLPMEFAVEAQKLLGISLEGSVG
jgi:Fe-S cluster assembly protein SufB